MPRAKRKSTDRRNRTKTARQSSGRNSSSNKSSRKSLKTKAQQIQLDQIEELLGEDFNSLAEAKKALAAESGPRPFKKSYTVKELSTRKNKKVNQFLSDLDEHKQDIDALKNPDEFWAFAIANDDGRTYHSYSLFSDTERLVSKLGTYKGLQDESTKLLGNISVIRVKGVEANKYFSMKKREVHETWKRRQEKKRVDSKRKRSQDKKLKKAETELKAAHKRIAELEKKLRGKK